MTGGADTQPKPEPAQRIDRWLWFARFFKSRTLAAAEVVAGKIRVNGDRVTRASRLVKPGDVLTFALGPHIRVIRVLDTGTRRGPAPEAQLLYLDQAPPENAPRPDLEHLSAQREPGAGRPTKRDRRKVDALKDFDGAGNPDD